MSDCLTRDEVSLLFPEATREEVVEESRAKANEAAQFHKFEMIYVWNYALMDSGELCRFSLDHAYYQIWRGGQWQTYREV